MRVAVTGGRGFIGRQLVTRLVARGDDVRVLTRHPDVPATPGATMVTGDLATSETSLVRLVDGADVVYHCAGETMRPSNMRGVHVGGAERLAAAARGRIGKWVQLSSVGAYGPVRSGVVTEDSPEAPESEYERTKTDGDHVVQQAAAERAFRVCLVRPSIVFGPTMSNRSLLGLIKAVDRRLFFFIGPPGASANYIHVDNVVEALVRCGLDARSDGRTYILSDHREIEEFVATIARALGRREPRARISAALARVVSTLGGFLPAFPLTSARVAALTTRAKYSTERIEQELGYAPVVTMEEGLRQLVLLHRDP